MGVSRLAVRFAHFLIGSWKLVLLRNLLLFFFVHRICLEYSSLDESDESDELGSEYRSAGMFGTGLG